MNITSFNPLIVTRNAQAAIALFEAMGFERRHGITVTSNGKDITSIRLKDSGGFYVDVAQVDGIQPDLTLIRMNVDDFDEAYAWLIERGFKNARGEDTSVDTRTNRSAMMIAPSGFAFDLCQHIKDNE